MAYVNAVNIGIHVHNLNSWIILGDQPISFDIPFIALLYSLTQLGIASCFSHSLPKIVATCL
jgi:hypothetical protein